MSSDRQDWRELNRAALYETDPDKLLTRVADAERALLLEARALFAVSGGNGLEGQVIDDALYALRALRNCVRLKTTERKAA